jgi:hypothetical protein
MADQDVKLGIQTTADVSGLQQVNAGIVNLTAEEARYAAAKAGLLTAQEREVAEVERLVAASKRLKETRDAEIKAQRDADVEEAKRRVAAKVALETISHTTTNTGKGMAGLTGLMTQAGYQITDFSVQVQMGTSVLTAFSQQFPQLLGAIEQSGIMTQKIGKSILSTSIGLGTAISGIAVAAGIGIQMAVNEYGKMDAAQKAAAESAKRHQKLQGELAEARQRVLNQAREEAISRAYAKQADDLERQVNALNRLQEIRAAEGALAGAKASAAVTQATNAGGNVAGAKTGALEVDFNNQMQALADNLADAQLASEKAANDALAAKVMMTEVGRTSGDFSDKYKEATAAWETADKAAEKANLDLAAEREKFPIAQAALAAQFGAELDTLRTETAAEMTRQAQEMQGKIEAMAPAAFSKASFALGELKKILEDGEVKPEEMADLKTAMDRLRGSQEGRDKEVMKGLDKLANLSESYSLMLQGFQTRLLSLEKSAEILFNRTR